MSKPFALLYAVLSTLLMTATAISISYGLWPALALALITLVFIGSGFMIKARLRRKQNGGS